MKAVIQAGGKGTRLQPFTLVLPKPLMPVGDLPVIEWILKWLRRSGFTEICITTGYLGQLIRALCGDGSQWDVQVSYSKEPEPLGTIGALSLLRHDLREPFLVLNGDVVTDLDLRGFCRYHRSHGGDLTVAVARKEVRVDLGVVHASGDKVEKFEEKPTFSYLVSMGIYLMDPNVLDLIPDGVSFGFDDLMYEMLEAQMDIHVYRHAGTWMDLGRPADLQRIRMKAREEDTGVE